MPGHKRVVGGGVRRTRIILRRVKNGAVDTIVDLCPFVPPNWERDSSFVHRHPSVYLGDRFQIIACLCTLRHAPRGLTVVDR